MPIYEYACTSCGHRFERKQGFHETPVTTCPICSGPVRKVLHPVGVVFKGSGWYITDSRPRPTESTATDTQKAGESKTEAPTTEKKTEARQGETSAATSRPATPSTDSKSAR